MYARPASFSHYIAYENYNVLQAYRAVVTLLLLTYDFSKIPMGFFICELFH